MPHPPTRIICLTGEAVGTLCSPGKGHRSVGVSGCPGWIAIPAIRNHRIRDIEAPLILQPGPAMLTDGLDAIRAALWPEALGKAA